MAIAGSWVCAEVARHEAPSWRHVDLHFAVVGFPKCGTNSISRVLSRFAARVSRNASGLPKVPGPTSVSDCPRCPGLREDTFFQSVNNGHDEAFIRRRVRRFNDCRFDGAAAGPCRAPRYVQEDPLVAYNPGGLRALAQVARLRAVAMVRDPAEQFVSFYNHLASYAVVDKIGVLPPLRRVVADTIQYRRYGRVRTRMLEGGFHVAQLYVNAGRFSEQLGGMRELFAERLRVFHLDEFRGGPAATKEAMLALYRFLGVPAAGQPVALPRENRGTGLGELCGRHSNNTALRRMLVGILADEYTSLYSPESPLRRLRRGPCEPPVGR